MSYKTRAWLIAAGVRVAQTAMVILIEGSAISEINIKHVASVVLVGMVSS